MQNKNTKSNLEKENLIFGEHRFISKNDPAVSEAAESTETAESSTQYGVMTPERAKLIDQLKDKHQNELKTYDTLLNKSEGDFETLETDALTALSDEDKETKTNTLIGRIRNGIDAFISKMLTAAGVIDGADDKYKRHFIGEKVKRVLKHEHQLQGDKWLTKHEKSDRARLDESEAKHKNRLGIAKTEYQNDVKELKDLVSETALEDDEGKLPVFAKAAKIQAKIRDDLQALKDDQFGFSDVKGFASQAIKSSEDILKTTEKVGIESNWGGFAESVVEFAVSGTSVKKAEEKVNAAVEKAKKDNTAVSRKEAINTYGEQILVLSDELRDWYEEVSHYTIRSSNKDDFGSIYGKVHAIVAALKRLQKKIGEVKETGLYEPYEEEMKNMKEKLDKEYEGLRKKYNYAKDAGEDSDRAKSFRKELEAKVIEYLNQAREINGKSQSMLGGYKPANLPHFSKEKVALLLNHVEKLNNEFLYDETVASVVAQPAAEDDETIEPSEVPNRVKIDALIKLRKAGKKDTAEYKKLKEELYQICWKANPADRAKMEKYLRQQGYKVDMANKDIVEITEETIPGDIEKLLKDSSLAWLAPLVTVIFKFLENLKPVPAAQPIAPDDPRIVELEGKIAQLEAELSKPLHSVLPTQQQQIDQFAQQQLQQLDEYQKQLEEFQKQIEQTNQAAGQMAILLFPAGDHQVICQDGCFCLPGVPLPMLKWRASLNGCSPQAVNNGITSVGGMAGFSAGFSAEFMSNPNGVFNKMAAGYERPYNDFSYPQNTANNMLHFNNCYRRALSAGM